MILSKLTQRNDFKRKKGENIRLFWLRFDRLQGQLRGFNVEWPVRLCYMKVFYALDLNTEQRMMINSTMESRNAVGDIEELKRISIKIFDVSDEKLEDDTFQANEVDEDAASTNDGETDELTCALQKQRSGKAKSKAGNLERSVQSTKSLFGGGEKASAEENQCLRCHQYGNWWRDCPMPFDKTVVSPNAKAGKPQQGKSS